MFSGLIDKLQRRQDLTEDEAASAMNEIMEGRAQPAQIAGLLIALAMKGERPAEVVGLAKTMRAKATPLSQAYADVFDTCGTGGDGQGTFNVSTAAAFVAAGAGARIAKHGNRAMTSGCGSADLLEALGAKIDLSPAQVAECIERTGFGFMFAQAFHPAMKHAAGPRRELGVRTVFNILGPLTNPARESSRTHGPGRRRGNSSHQPLRLTDRAGWHSGATTTL